MTAHHLLRRMVNCLLLALTTIICMPAITSTGEMQVHCQPLSAQQLENLIAFTKLYGYIRFFHPSDEAARIDWERFAVYGCTRMLMCSDRDELKVALNQLFAPIGPSVVIYDTGNSPGTDVGKLIQQDTSRVKMVAWQHLGIGLSPQSAYSSIRLNRRNTKAGGNAYGFGTITGNIEPSTLRGKRITLRAAVRVDQGGRGQLWLRVDRPEKKMGFFDNMNDRPILSTRWQYYEITGIVDSDAVSVYFGCMLMGAGKLWLDDLHMLSGETNRQEVITLANADFESDSLGAPPKGWICRSPGYAVEVTSETASTGTKSVSLGSATIEQPSELFPERHVIGEVFSSNLPGGISCRIPLTLFADSSGTLPRANRKELDGLTKKMEGSLPIKLSGNDRSVRLADIIISWNIFQHFYPYFDVTDVNWENELPEALRQACRDTSELDFVKTLQRFVAKLRDGHGRAMLASDTSESFMPPIEWTWAENSLVVTATFDSSRAAPTYANIVTKINGVPAQRAIDDEEVFISGATSQWRRLGALVGLLSGPKNSKMELTTVDGAGTERTVILTRTLTIMQYFTLQREHQRPTAKLNDGVYYLNLSISTMAVIDSLMPDLANARGVICDLRGYPNSNHELISHLLTGPDTSTHWMAIPKTIYPDRKKSAGYDYTGWQLLPKQPHIGGKVVFLTDGRAISYAESYMGFIEHYRLAEIVGEPTAGTNGNVNPFTLPGGYRLTWTGMRVTKHDGSRHHGVGIQPTVLVHRTVKGIREGKDEQLDVALELINKTTR